MEQGIIEIFQQMVTLFIIVGVGYAAKRLNIMTDDFDKKLSKVIINLSLPAMILGAVLTAEELPRLKTSSSPSDWPAEAMRSSSRSPTRLPRSCAYT